MVREGYLYSSACLVAGLAVGFFLRSWGWAFVPFLLGVFFLSFFRDPERDVPDTMAGVVVSPADGKLTRISRIVTPEGERIRLSIFLSVFDVHINRSPIAGVVREVKYRKGQYLNALNPESAEKNEQNSVTVQGDDFAVVFVQIAGLLARRIVFWPKVGDFVGRGQRVGLIKFGSRVDVLLPGNAQIRVNEGQRVRGGSSVLAEVPWIENEPAADILAESLA